MLLSLRIIKRWRYLLCGYCFACPALLEGSQAEQKQATPDKESQESAEAKDTTSEQEPGEEQRLVVAHAIVAGNREAVKRELQTLQEKNRYFDLRRRLRLTHNMQEDLKLLPWDGETVLHIATRAAAKAKQGHQRATQIEILQAVLAEKEVDVDAPSFAGGTPLMVACRAGDLEIARLLLTRGATVSKKSKDGRSALTQAAESRNPALVTYLIEEAGAEVNPVSKEGEVYQLPLGAAASQGDLEMVKLLLACGAAANAADSQGNSPLLYVLEKMLRSGQEPHELRGESQQHLEKLSQCYAVANHLLTHPEVDPNHQNGSGLTALHYAAGSGWTEMVKLLLARKELRLDLRASGSHGTTPLLWATMHHLDVVDLLLKDGRELALAAQGRWGMTALHYAVEHGWQEVVKQILSASVDPGLINKPNHKGETPLHFAVGRLEMVKLLISHGADPTLLDHLGHTPLVYAAHTGAQDIVAYLRRHMGKPSMPNKGRKPDQGPRGKLPRWVAGSLWGLGAAAVGSLLYYLYRKLRGDKRGRWKKQLPPTKKAPSSLPKSGKAREGEKR